MEENKKYDDEYIKNETYQNYNQSFNINHKNVEYIININLINENILITIMKKTEQNIFYINEYGLETLYDIKLYFNNYKDIKQVYNKFTDILLKKQILNIIISDEDCKITFLLENKNEVTLSLNKDIYNQKYEVITPQPSFPISLNYYDNEIKGLEGLKENNSLKKKNKRINYINNITKKESKNLNSFSENGLTTNKLNNNKLQVISDKVTSTYFLDNQIDVFKSKQNENFIIYIDNNKRLILYNLDYKTKKIIEENFVNNFNSYFLKHCYDELNNNDLIIITCIKERKCIVIIYDITNFKNILQLQLSGNLLMAKSIGISDKVKGNYLVVYEDYNNLCIYDFKGEEKECFTKNNSCFYITYYKDEQNNIYVITCHSNEILATNFEKITVKKFNDNENGNLFYNALVYKQKNFTKLIGIDYLRKKSYIRIWDFNTGILESKLNLSDGGASLCLYKENYLYIGTMDNNIKLLDLSNLKIISSFKIHDQTVCSIRKIEGGIFKDCFISYSSNDKIILWTP